MVLGSQWLSMRVPSVFGRVYWCLALFSASGLTGCATRDGTDPYALFETYKQPEGLYRFRYLSPPWVMTADDSAARQLLAVAPHRKDLGFELETGSLEARFKVVVEVLDTDSVKSAVALDTARWSDHGAEIGPFVIFASAGGAMGLRVEAVFLDRRMVSIYHALRGGGVGVMRAAAQERMDTDDMNLLFRGFEPTGSPR
jgi:hypothetical protein